MTPFSLWTLAVLIAVLAVSWWMLFYLMKTWTVGRRRQRLREWATVHRMRATGAVPAVLGHDLGALGAVKVVIGFADETRFACRLKGERSPASVKPLDPSNWSLVGLRAPEELSVQLAALRPGRMKMSLVDVLAAATPPHPPRLLSYPSIETADAFTVFAGSQADALRLAGSSVPNELPDDLGLLVKDGWLILDLSARSFDDLELPRALELLKGLSTLLRPT